MVEELRFYYSKDGTETQGPVSKTVLTQLFRDQVITAESFICREDESAWRTLDPAMFQFRPKLRAAPPGYRQAQPAPSPKRSRSKPGKRRRDAWYTETNLLDPRFLRTLNVICLVITLIGALLSIHLRFVVFKEALGSTEEISLLGVVGYFVMSAGVIFILPYLFSLFFRHPHRRPALVVGSLLAAPLFLWVEYELFSSDVARHALFARETTVDTSESDLPWIILPNGYLDFTPALQNLQDVRDAASTDTTEMSVIRGDLVVVIDGLVTRLKACNAAAATCAPFNPLTLGSLDDINTRISLISALRDSQAELGDFLQATVDNCRRAVSKDNFASATVDEAIASFRQSTRTDQLSSVTAITMKISDDETAALKILAQNWGHWHIDNSNIIFEDPNVLANFTTSMQSVENDLQALHDLAKQ